MVQTLLLSAGLVAVAEIGDKTQLLAIVLASKFRKPLTIIAGVLVATLLNHARAAWAGFLVADRLQGSGFQLAVGAAFIGMAAWALIHDKADEEAAARGRGGVFLTTLVSFFLVEIGDKTQIATSLLAARFHDVALVAAGTTAGMMAANIPAVFLGEAVTRVVPMAYVRAAAAAILGLVGLWAVASALGAV